MMRNFTFLFLFITSTWSFAQVNIPIDFESMNINYMFENFEGGVMEVIDNPDMSGINNSDRVARMVKNPGAVFAGSAIELENPIDFSGGKYFKMKVWSPEAGRKVLFKIENPGDPGIFFQKEVTTTAGNTWEEIEFNFTAASNTQTYQKLIFIFDNGTVGDGSANFTYYVDDIELFDGGGGLGQIDLPITFEDTANVDYALMDFGGNVSMIVQDPTDPMNIVLEAVKTDMAETWAGTTIGENGLANAIPFTNGNTKMSVRVWSPDANTPVRLKVEDASNATISVETEVNTTMAGQWETLEFDFSNEAPGTAAINLANTYNKVSIFLNFGTGGAMAGEKTYYVDDVQFVTGTSVNNIKASEAGLKLYPNPANDQFTIDTRSLKANSSELKLTIYAIDGSVIRQIDIADEINIIPINDLMSGIYHVRIENGNNSYYQKLVISK